MSEHCHLHIFLRIVWMFSQFQELKGPHLESGESISLDSIN